MANLGDFFAANAAGFAVAGALVFMFFRLFF